MTAKVEIKFKAKILDKKNEPEFNNSFDIYGFKDPKIILQSGRNFIAVKEREDLTNKKNRGVVFTKDDGALKIDVKDDINEALYKPPFLGGSINFYDKYIKYKTKYIELKRHNIN